MSADLHSGVDYAGLEASVLALLREKFDVAIAAVRESPPPGPGSQDYAEGELAAPIRFGIAARLLAEALRADPASPLAGAACAGLYMTGPERVRVLERIVQRWPTLERPKFWLGSVRLRARDYAGAIEAFRAALSIDSDDQQALVGLGGALLRTKDRAGARECAERIVRSNPNQPSWHGRSALLLFRAGRARRALQVAWRASRIGGTWQQRVFALTLPLQVLSRRAKLAFAVLVTSALLVWFLVSLLSSNPPNGAILVPILAGCGLQEAVRYGAGGSRMAKESRLLRHERKRSGGDVSRLLSAG